MLTRYWNGPLISHHAMPFGAEVQSNGSVRFRLWAPAARGVDLSLDSAGKEKKLPLVAIGDGWWERLTAEAKACNRYFYLIDNEHMVPDPASRFQPEDVHGPSEVIDAGAFDWGGDEWCGRPWHEAILYELHVGTFGTSGDFAGIEAKLDYLTELGITAVQLMPISDFPGKRDWGYNGVFPFAPDSRYGRPEDLKRLIRAAHNRGLMVFLDVVFNHFGPEGNYLHLYAPSFFNPLHRTPWGDAINFDGQESRTVRDFFIHNALFWLEEYRLDGLRLDAVHAIHDDSRPDILEELAEAVETTIGKERHVHLVLENDNNASHYLRQGYRAQWNDDLHHCLHLLTTGERDGYYGDYADHPLQQLGRCLAEGFAYQGEVSTYREGHRRGEPSDDLPPTAFVGFLQNHDQVGNRAFGERMTELATPEAIRAVTVLLLLSPQPPLLFMGQEWGTRRRFPFFCDFEPKLAQTVSEGRRKEFARFERFRDPEVRARIPDPNDPDTFFSACLDWEELDHPWAQYWLDFHSLLLARRQEAIIPLLPDISGHAGRWRELKGQGLEVYWQLQGGSEIVLFANLCEQPLSGRQPAGRCLYTTHEVDGPLPPWFVGWYLCTGNSP